MSDPRHDAPMAPPPQPTDAQENGAGTLLRRARERAGLDVAALAATLKVPRARIESLEAGRFDELPDGVYARSLASSICRALRTDAQPILALLPHAVSRPLDSVAEHKSTRIKSNGAGGRAKFSPASRARSHVSRRALALTAVLVLAAAAVLLMPQGAFDRMRAALLPAWKAAPGDAGAARTAFSGGRVVEEVAVPPTSAETVHPSDAAGDAANALAPATPSSIVAAQPTAGGGAPTAGQGSAPAAPPSAPAEPTAAQPDGLLVISASAPTWIKVADAKGTVLVQKTLGAGQVESVQDGAVPLAVTIGRIDTTTVQVRGEAFDLAPRARNNVARFEVK